MENSINDRLDLIGDDMKDMKDAQSVLQKRMVNIEDIFAEIKKVFTKKEQARI